MTDNIKVAIKVRRLLRKEVEARLKIRWAVKNNTIVEFDPKSGKQGKTKYQFDNIFDSDKTNLDIFNLTAKPIVEAAMRGFNGTIFAFGQTGSGKTYTMMGPKEEPGVIPLTIKDIFKHVENNPDRIYLLRVSFIEICNEKINDLLDAKKKNIKLKEDVRGNVIVECKEEMANSVNDVLRAMVRGDKQRRIGLTNMNDKSNRSHTIFRIAIESCERENPTGTMKISQLNLVDLAGSERVNQTGASGETLRQGQYINKSLSTLSLVIKQLSEKGKHHVNFRDSKLTRILQASLGGNTLTTIICAVTPANSNETKRTLAFAHRAKGIKNDPQINEIVSGKILLDEVLKQVETLTTRIREMESELQKNEKNKEIFLARIELLNNKIISETSAENRSQDKKKRRKTWGGIEKNFVSASAETGNFGLGTIFETENQKSKTTTKDEYVRRGESFIQQMNLSDASLQTEYPDFELKIISDGKKKILRQSLAITDDDKIANQVHPGDDTRDNPVEMVDLCSPEKISLRKATEAETLHLKSEPSSEMNFDSENVNNISFPVSEKEPGIRGTELKGQLQVCEENRDIMQKLKEEEYKNLKIETMNEKLKNEIKILHELMDEMVMEINNRKKEQASCSCGIRYSDFSEDELSKKLREDNEKNKTKQKDPLKVQEPVMEMNRSLLNQKTSVGQCEEMSQAVMNLKQEVAHKDTEIRCLQSLLVAYNSENGQPKNRRNFLSPILERHDEIEKYREFGAGW